MRERVDIITERERAEVATCGAALPPLRALRSLRCREVDYVTILMPIFTMPAIDMRACSRYYFRRKGSVAAAEYGIA